MVVFRGYLPFVTFLVGLKATKNQPEAIHWRPYTNEIGLSLQAKYWPLEQIGERAELER
jgi:hypothetical protein